MLTPIGTVSYPQVFEPRLNEQNGKMEFSVQLRFDSGTDLTALKKAIKEALVKKFGENYKTKYPTLRLPFKSQKDLVKRDDNGNEFVPEGVDVDGYYLQLRTKTRPGVIDKDGKTPIVESSDLYPGCKGRAFVSVYAYDMAGNRGANFGLQHLQKCGEGEPLGGRVRPESAFAPIEDTDDFGSADSGDDLL